MSKNEREWDKAYLEASAKLVEHPLKLELLQKIYTNPEYYAGYVTRKIVGNLSLNGTVSAEQNHSSIVRFNGDMMLGSICDHIKALCERQQQLCNKENDFENDYVIKSSCYKSMLDGEYGQQEYVARQILSQKPLKDYFIKQLQSSQVLQSSFDELSMSHNIWPAAVDFNPSDDEHITIKVGDRCNCWRRVDFDIQCKHELKLSCKFKKEHWGHRWYNRRQFNADFPDMSTFSTNVNVIDVDQTETTNASVAILPPVQEEDEVQYLSVEDSENTVFNLILDRNGTEVTYKDVLEIATDLCRTVSDNAKLCKSTYATIFEWITKLRHGDEFDTNFCNRALPGSQVSKKAKNPCQQL